jgi:uncharacterized protein YjbI with pentapeptide repeats
VTEEWQPCRDSGCRGAGVHDGSCLAHLSASDLERVLAQGTPLDARGATVDWSLLNRVTGGDRIVRRAVRFDHARFGPEISLEGVQFLGPGSFAHAVFEGPANFGGTVFHEPASFSDAMFCGSAGFAGARFEGEADFGGVSCAGYAGFGEAWFGRAADFGGARFDRVAWFGGAEFSDVEFGCARFGGLAGFGRARFRGPARFAGTRFGGDAAFDDARCEGEVSFEDGVFVGGASFCGARFVGVAGFAGARWLSDAHFDRADFGAAVEFTGLVFETHATFAGCQFAQADEIGPMRGEGTVVLDDAVMGAALTLRIDAARVSCCRTHFAQTADLDLNVVELSLEGARFVGEATLSAGPRMPGSERTGRGRLVSLRDAQINRLNLRDLDLAPCLFSGAQGLDRVVIPAMSQFQATPRRRGSSPGDLISRPALAEEHHWRVDVQGESDGWLPERCRVLWAGQSARALEILQPQELADLYRALAAGQRQAHNRRGWLAMRMGERAIRHRVQTAAAPADPPVSSAPASHASSRRPAPGAGVIAVALAAIAVALRRRV